MKVYFSNLPSNIDSSDLWEFIAMSLDDSYVPYAQNTIFIDSNIGFADIMQRRGHEMPEDEIINQLNSRLFNERKIAAEVSNETELGRYVASKIRSLWSDSNYSFTDDKVRRKWRMRSEYEIGLDYTSDGDDCYRYISPFEQYVENDRELSAPSLARELDILAQDRKMKPVYLKEKLIAPVFPLWDFACAINIDVYEAMANDRNSLLVHAFMRTGKPGIPCWRAISISNHTGQMTNIPKERYWKENFMEFLNEVRKFNRI